MDDPDTPAKMGHREIESAQGSSTQSIVIVRFDGSGSAERMVASLGRSFRKLARSGQASVFVVTRKRDGSFKLVQSRVVTTSGVVSAGIGVTVATLSGFVGTMSAIRGAKAVGHATRQRQAGVGRDAERLAALFDELGPHAAIGVFVCTDDETANAVVSQAKDRGHHTSQHPQAEVLAQLDQLGSEYEWIRPAFDEPVGKASKQNGPAQDPRPGT